MVSILASLLTRRLLPFPFLTIKGRLNISIMTCDLYYFLVHLKKYFHLFIYLFFIYLFIYFLNLFIYYFFIFIYFYLFLFCIFLGGRGGGRRTAFLFHTLSM